MEITMSAENKEIREGTKITIQYVYSLEEATAPSFFQVVKNFENVITKTSGKRIYYSKDGGVATFSTRSGEGKAKNRRVEIVKM